MTINCKGQLINLSAPKVMGILNLTPDSFYDGGRYNNQDEILQQTEKMLHDGATFIDVGAYSSRPGAAHVSETEELERILPVLHMLLESFPEILISIDTFRSQVAKACINAGACMINDISAGHLDKAMLNTIAQLNVPYIMMHSRGTPQTMQQLTDYEDLVKDILFYFSERIAKARKLGLVDLIIDPGFGFAKTIPQNFELLHKLELLHMAELPILIGLSRKSMIYKTLNTTSEKALNGTTALNMMALHKGAHILRVHDVKEAMECINLSSALN
ncbi:dihydropteroate synthase [Sediminibacter sp. Hel_I_10]|uniref:dihydropteroate synthase n=1 Tax=Sediminibacter sp. Hel_I_10 TaxID=1392490 RepID=UPI00047AC286|nr:dihydropteroate synthase [Sediminibacter sp. Hel_I_10]